MSDIDLAGFWHGFYTERDQVWSGNPNTQLVREVSDLAPGTALDIGCAEGADAIWLAQRGWRVTATDISAVAIDRGRAQAETAGVGDRIEWEQHDLGVSFPDGQFDLVSAQFFHSPIGRPRDGMLQRAAAAVAPGGTLLLVSHLDAPGEHNHHPEITLPTQAETLAGLELDADWEAPVLDERYRDADDRHGGTRRALDGVIRVRRSTARE